MLLLVGPNFLSDDFDLSVVASDGQRRSSIVLDSTTPEGIQVPFDESVKSCLGAGHPVPDRSVRGVKFPRRMRLIPLLSLRLGHLGPDYRRKNQYYHQSYDGPAESISHFKSLLEVFSSVYYPTVSTCGAYARLKRRSRPSSARNREFPVGSDGLPLAADHALGMMTFEQSTRIGNTRDQYTTH